MNRFLFPLALVLAFGCASDPVASLTQEIAVPGAWNPPEGVRRAAAAQRVDVVDPPNLRPLGTCSGPGAFDLCDHPACIRAHPGTTELDNYIRTRWPYVRAYGTYTCRRNSNNLDELSVHAIGRAIDAGIQLTPDSDADNTLGDAVANWLIANAEHIGIQRVGWDGMWWNGERGFIPMRGDPHKNHLHIELSVDGAARRTRFFTEGPPAETCPIVCYGTAAVAEDCSYVDCALSGQVCMSDPVRCETAGPPEPPMATLNAAAVRPTLSAIGGPSRFNFVGPLRLFDTRDGADSTRLVRSDGSSNPLSATRTGTVRDFPSLPAMSSGVWLNLAALLPAAPGFVVVYPEGSPRPMTSTLNFAMGEARSNAAPVPFGTGGGVTFEAISEAQIIADLVGAFAPEGVGLRNAGPLRVEDSRAGAGVPAMTEYRVDVRAPSEAVGVLATVAVISTQPGFVTAYPCGGARPETSSINYAPSGVVANTVVSAISDGDLCFWSSSAIEIIVDVAGYFVPEGELSYQPVASARLLDTRDSDSLYTGRIGNLQVVEIPIQSLAGAPAGIRSVVVNLTTVQTDSAGYLTAFPCGFDPPLSSSLNYGGREVVGTVAVSTIGAGSLCVFSYGRTHLIVDLLGVWVPTPGAPPPTMTDPPPPNTDDGDAGVPGADAGPSLDGGPGIDGGADAGPGGDAGMPADLSSGCGCTVASKTDGRSALLSLLGFVALWVRRRRTRGAR